MTESTRKKGLYGLLVVAVLFGVYSFSQPRLSSPSPAALQLENQPDQTTATAPARPVINVTSIQEASWGSDPFRRQRSGSGTLSARPTTFRLENPTPMWKLSGIVFNRNLPLAIINGRTVKIGDVVNQAQIIKIDPKKVTLLYNGARIEIPVNKG